MNCSVQGCTRPHFGSGYCQTHYRRLIRNGSTDGATLPEWQPDVATERRVLDLVARGFTYAEISSVLGLSVSRIKEHVRALKRRAGVDRKHELIAWSLDSRRRRS